MATPKSKIHNPQSADAVDVDSGSVEDTQALGEQIGAALRPGDVVALRGELGSGKTTIIQGIAKGLGCDPGAVKSPTFVLMHEYPGTIPVVHVDGYRLEGPASVAWLDIDLIFSRNKVTLIEWAERFAELLPADRLELHLSHVSANRRKIALVPYGARATEVAHAAAGH